RTTRSLRLRTPGRVVDLEIRWTLRARGIRGQNTSGGFCPVSQCCWLRPPAGLNPMEPLPGAALTPLTHSAQLLQALKEEMFALETDHLQHLVSDEDYVAQKAALELVLRRALQRSSAAANAPELISR